MHRYIGTHMHLHTTFEAFSTMRSQAFMAKKLGIEALFITDHDTRMGYLQKRVNEFAYESEDAVQMRNGIEVTWSTMEGEPIAPIKTEDGWVLALRPGQSARFFAKAKQHQASLLADLTLYLDLDLPEEWAGGLCVDLELSLSPDNKEQQHLCYVMGDCPQQESWEFCIPLAKAKGKCRLELPISQDILRFDPFGQDHCFIALLLHTFGPLKGLYLGHRMDRKYAAEAVRQKQQELADEVSKKCGVALHVATEISGAGQHKVSFSQSVPLLDYPAHDYQITWEMAAAHVKKHGGVTSYNHMFTPYQKREWRGEEREQLIQGLIQSLLDTHAEGADLIEVGFPEGRGGFRVEEYIRVWDALAMQGLLLSGYGDNDCHNSKMVWLEGNNFATFWYAENANREALEQALLTGNAYTMDPARLQGLQFGFSLEDTPMGGILIGNAEATAALHLQQLPEAAEIRLMAGGACQEKKILAPGDHALAFQVIKNAPICPVRVEIWGMDGRLLLLSNPVYWVDEDIPGYETRLRKKL
ncbi:MAG: hypothetical protein E7329_01475 [Clostridiales bacterium]|nr:hypothetical protein [Clostridiales bacterium]